MANPLIMVSIIWIAVFCILFFPIHFLSKNKPWWVKGTLLLIVSLLCLIYLVFFAMNVECAIFGGSSPCGIVSVPLFIVETTTFLILGITFLIRNKIKYTNKKRMKK